MFSPLCEGPAAVTSTLTADPFSEFPPKVAVEFAADEAIAAARSSGVELRLITYRKVGLDLAKLQAR